MFIEQLLHPKQRNGAAATYNEDHCGQLGNTFWLLDGASSPKRLLANGTVPDGRWLVHRLDLALRQVLLTHPALSLAQTLAACEDLMHDDVLQACKNMPRVLCPNLVPHTTVVLLRLHKDHAEYALLQDSVLLAKQVGEIQAFKDPRQDRLNAAFYREQADFLGGGESFSGEGYNLSLDRMVNREREVRNQPGGFWTFTGLKGAAAQCVTGELVTQPGDAFVLASDGAARYWDVLGLPRDDAFSRPLPDLAKAVRAAESQDPTGALWPRTGHSDDIGMLRIALQ